MIGRTLERYVSDQSEKPDYKSLKRYFEDLLNPDKIEYADMPTVTNVICIPVLDDPITSVEVKDVLEKQVKAEKGCGPDGLLPKQLKCLPIQWILFFTQIFNTVLHTVYPQDWCFSRIVTLFKKGNLLDCGNYRGISLMNCIPKIYDYILYNRLAAWFKPDMEQAGAQPKRGCMEHIISLRLLIDYAIVKKKKLYIVYVDFSKAYDRVHRGKLVHLLAAMGCGAVMLAALASMYKVSYGIIGITVITCTIGVRQGSPNSCFLFTMYVNPLLRKLKSQCQNDGFLQWLHALMLMDDTVLLASDRDIVWSTII